MREGWCNRPNYIQMYIPSRTAIVLKPLIIEKPEKHVEETPEIEVPAPEQEDPGYEDDDEAEEGKNAKEKDEKDGLVLFGSDS